MKTETTLVWHHVTHEGGVATGLPEGKGRDMVVFYSFHGMPVVDYLFWANGEGNLMRGFWEYRDNGYFTGLDIAYVIAWAELPTADEVLTDEEKELYS